MITKRPLKYKNEWDEVTKNGKYQLADIISCDSIKLCHNCKTQNSNNAEFCKSCGSNLSKLK